MRLRKKVGIDLKKRARDFKHLERERESCYLHLRMMRENFIVLMVNVSLARGEINGQVRIWEKLTSFS